MAFKPNRPVRVGTKMLVTNAKGEVPKQSSASKGTAERPALSGLTKAQLIEAAKAERVEIGTDDNKAQLIAKIERARA